MTNTVAIQVQNVNPWPEVATQGIHTVQTCVLFIVLGYVFIGFFNMLVGLNRSP